MIFENCDIAASNLVPSAIKCIFDYTNIGQGAIAGTIILFAVIVALFGMTKSSNGSSRAGAAVMFVSIPAAIIMAKLGWVSSKAVYFCIALFIYSIFNLERSTENQ